MACLRVLLKLDFEQQRARLCARLFRGRQSGRSLFARPEPLSTIRADDSNGIIAADAELKLAARFGSLERWDGKRGPGLPSIKSVASVNLADQIVEHLQSTACGGEGQCDTQASTCCKSERKT